MNTNGHFFYGTEHWLIDEAVSALHATSFPNHDIQRFDGEACTLEAVGSATQHMGLFASQTLIILKNPAFLSKSPSKEDAKRWVTLFKTGVGTQCAITVIYYGSPDMRKSCASALKKTFKTAHYDPFKEWESDKFSAWIAARATAKGKPFSPAALDLFCALTGNQRQRAAADLDVLCLLTTTPTITEEAITASCSTAQAQLYHLLEALKSRDIPTCFKQLRLLKEQGEDPLKILGLVVSQCRFFIQLLLLSELGAAGIAQKIGKHPFFVKQVLRVVTQHHRLPSLVALLRDCARLDRAIKTGTLHPTVVFSVLPARL